MTEVATRGEDPFGTTVAERLVRRLAGAGTATLVVGGGLLLWLPPGAVIAAAVIYLVGIPLSLWLERRWPAADGPPPVRRYAGLGAVLATVVIVAIAVGFAGSLGSPLAALTSLLPVGVPAGMIAGALAAGVAHAVSWRWAVVVAAAAPPAAVAFTVGVLAIPGYPWW